MSPVVAVTTKLAAVTLLTNTNNTIFLVPEAVRGLVMEALST
jgi:hypothetical protein